MGARFFGELIIVSSGFIMSSGSVYVFWESGLCSIFGTFRSTVRDRQTAYSPLFLSDCLTPLLKFVSLA